MGAGDEEAGSGLAGVDSPVTSLRATGSLATALLFDLSSKSTLVDADGFARVMDPTDQEVLFCLCVQRRSLPSSPDVGMDYDRIARASKATLQRLAEDEVNVALVRPLERGDVRVLEVHVTRSGGRVSLLVDYVNLRTRAPQRAEASYGA
jgi:hypothetical protein